MSRLGSWSAGGTQRRRLRVAAAPPWTGRHRCPQVQRKRPSLPAVADEAGSVSRSRGSPSAGLSPAFIRPFKPPLLLHFKLFRLLALGFCFFSPSSLCFFFFSTCGKALSYTRRIHKFCSHQKLERLRSSKNLPRGPGSSALTGGDQTTLYKKVIEENKPCADLDLYKVNFRCVCVLISVNDAEVVTGCFLPLRS